MVHPTLRRRDDIEPPLRPLPPSTRHTDEWSAPSTSTFFASSSTSRHLPGSPSEDASPGRFGPLLSVPLPFFWPHAAVASLTNPFPFLLQDLALHRQPICANLRCQGATGHLCPRTQLISRRHRVAQGRDVDVHDQGIDVKRRRPDDDLGLPRRGPSNLPPPPNASLPNKPSFPDSWLSGPDREPEYTSPF